MYNYYGDDMKRVLFLLVLFLLPIGFIFAEDIEKGDKVTYNNIDYFVLSVNDDYYTLIKDRPLTVDEVKQYGIGHINRYSNTTIHVPDGPQTTQDVEDMDGYGAIAYYSSPTCENMTNNDRSGCNSSYDSSEVKYVVDAWATQNLNSSDLKKDKLGYSYRLITSDEIIDNLGFEADLTQITVIRYKATSKSPSWIRNALYEYWTMTPTDDLEYVNMVNLDKIIISSNVLSYATIVPVVNIAKDKVILKQKAVSNIKNNQLKKKEYKKGEVVIYNNIKFYVLKDSSINDDKVTLIKATPLNSEELENSKVSDINKYAGEIPEWDAAKIFYPLIAYYSDEEGNSTTSYDKSEIKYVVDNWGKYYLNEEDLAIDEYGYSLRLLNKDDIINDLYYEAYENGEVTIGSVYMRKTELTPGYDLSGCWTMMAYEDDDRFIIKNYLNRYFYIDNVTLKSGVVCPVVTLQKKDVDSPIENNATVEVENTAKTKNLIVTIVGIIAIVSASIVISFKLVKKNKIESKQ